jgi:hypothetical protein
MPCDAATTDEPYGVQPELCDTGARLDVYVRGLGSIARVEEEPEPADAQDRRHRRSL